MNSIDNNNMNQNNGEALINQKKEKNIQIQNFLQIKIQHGIKFKWFSIDKEAYINTKGKYINPQKIEFLKVNNKHKESIYVYYFLIK